MFKQSRPIILASESPRRRQYLERYKLQFDIRTGDVDESVNNDKSPVTYAERLAREKGMVVADTLTDNEIVISADTIVVLDNQIIGKPKDRDNVLPMLKKLNGYSHQVITAYFIYDCLSRQEVSRTVTTRVVFNQVADELLQAYAKLEEPLDKAGAYSIQGAGTFLVKSIKGSYNNVVGLPIELLLQDLIDNKWLSYQ